jgi:hypothetical protein
VKSNIIASMKALYPARLTAEQVAESLGFQPHDIPVLVRAKLLKPLGKPSQQCTKYFAAAEIIAKGQDIVWLHKATETVYRRWRRGEEEPGA